MMIKRFQINYNRLRVICAMVACLAACYNPLVYSFSFDCEMPTREGMNRDKNERDRENREAYDRCNEGKGSSRDQERAAQYEREHVATR